VVIITREYRSDHFREGSCPSSWRRRGLPRDHRGQLGAAVDRGLASTRIRRPPRRPRCRTVARFCRAGSTRRRRARSRRRTRPRRRSRRKPHHRSLKWVLHLRRRPLGQRPPCRRLLGPLRRRHPLLGPPRPRRLRSRRRGMVRSEGPVGSCQNCSSRARWKGRGARPQACDHADCLNVQRRNEDNEFRVL